MAAYVIGAVEVTDPAAMEEYRTRVGEVVTRHGGRFLAAGAPEVREGTLHPHASVIIEFPSLEQARRWYDAADYRALRELRQRSTQTTLIFLDGLPIQ